MISLAYHADINVISSGLVSFHILFFALQSSADENSFSPDSITVFFLIQ